MSHPIAEKKPAERQGRGLIGLIRTLEVDTRLLTMLLALAIIWLGFHLVTAILPFNGLREFFAALWGGLQALFSNPVEFWQRGTFLTSRNLWNLAVQASVVGVMATGMVLVIVARHIDLSVGSILGFSAMMMAVFQTEIFPISAEWNWWVTVLLGLALGALIGAIHGFIIAYLEVPAFIVTLGGLLIWRGGAWLLTRGRTVSPLDPTYQKLGGGIDGSIGASWSWILGIIAIIFFIWLMMSARDRRRNYGFPVKPLWAEALLMVVGVAAIYGFVAVMNGYDYPLTDRLLRNSPDAIALPRGIAIPVLIWIGVALLMAGLVRFTRFGRYVFAMGGNPEAARLAGVKTRQVTLQIFILMGLLCAISGVIASARLNAGANSLGELDELEVIAAAVIGGTSLAGGVGTIPGAVLGTVLISSLSNGMVLIGWSSALQRVVQGLVLIVAVWLDVIYQRRRGR